MPAMHTPVASLADIRSIMETDYHNPIADSIPFGFERGSQITTTTPTVLRNTPYRWSKAPVGRVFPLRRCWFRSVDENHTTEPPPVSPIQMIESMGKAVVIQRSSFSPPILQLPTGQIPDSAWGL